MKRVLVLGATGMLGHKLIQVFHNRFDTWATARTSFAKLDRFGFYKKDQTITGVNADDFDAIVRAVGICRPDVVVNCIGIIKQLPEAYDPINSLKINSLFPHQLSRLCLAANARLIHISTDCIFNGKKGNYTESDPSDAEDLYGKTKFLGEISSDGCLTLRTSIIGREIASSNSLIDWFLSNRKKKIKGFANAVYTGFTTNQFAEIIAMVVESHEKLSGLYQVSSNPINKYELLQLANRHYDANVVIEKDTSFLCDRSLDSTRFRKKTGFTPPSWESMIEEMANDPTPYDSWHRD